MKKGIVISGTQSTQSGDLGQQYAFTKWLTETTQEVAAVSELLESSVLTSDPTAVNRGLIVHFTICDNAGVSKRLAVVHGDRMRMEAVASGTSHVITGERMKVAGFSTNNQS